jgi:hypothetical protein
MATKDTKSEEEGSVFTDSAEMFEDIFKEATQTIEKPKQGSRTPPDRRGAAPQKRNPQVEKKPAGSTHNPLRLGEKDRALSAQTIIKSEKVYKPKKRTSFLKIGILFVLCLMLGGAFLNYLGILDISSVLDLFGLGTKEVVQAPHPRRGPAKTPGNARRAPAKKQGGENVAAVPTKRETPAPVVAKQEPPKVQTPAPMVQTQPQQKVVREEPHPPVRPVQPKAETPAPTPPGRKAVQVTQEEATPPPVQAEAKQMPAPVPPRLPAVEPVQPQQVPPPVRPATPPRPAPQTHPKAREELATQVPRPPAVQTQPSVKPAATEPGPPQLGPLGYPYSIYLGSYQTLERAKKAISMYQHDGLPVYWSRVNLGEKGTWFRVFGGYFRTKGEASDFIAKKKIQDAEVKMTNYSVLIGVYSNREEAQQKAGALFSLGFPTYVIQEGRAKFRLYSGAFITKEGAEVNVAELASKGVQSRALER